MDHFEILTKRGAIEMKTVTIAALGLAAALAQLPVSAQARDAAPSVRVAYADLNLDSEAGLKTLDRRLAQAARTVCSDPNAEAELARRLDAQRCIAVTKAELAAARDRLLSRQAGTAQLAARGR
jgi:UrcA family protein